MGVEVPRNAWGEEENETRVEVEIEIAILLRQASPLSHSSPVPPPDSEEAKVER